MNKMNQQLPPPALVETWLNIIHSQDMPLDVIKKRTKLICYYFRTLELAYEYVEQNQFKHKQAS